MNGVFTFGSGMLSLKLLSMGQQLYADSIPYSYDPDTHLVKATNNGETEYLYLELADNKTLYLYCYDPSTGIDKSDYVILTR